MAEKKPAKKIEGQKINEVPKEKAEGKKEIVEDKKDPAKKADEKKEQKSAKKKSEAVMNSFNLPLSTKVSASICRFLMKKRIARAIAELEEVILQKRAIPMRGEIPHRKGKIMSGRYPKKASEYFIKLLKSLASNASVNGINEPVIKLAISNNASRPYGKFGRVRKKRTHVKLVAVERGGKK